MLTNMLERFGDPASHLSSYARKVLIIDDESILVSDTKKHRIVKYTLSDSDASMQLIVGSALNEEGRSEDGPGVDFLLSYPFDLAMGPKDEHGNFCVYCSELGFHRIIRIDFDLSGDHYTRTLTGGEQGFCNGELNEAKFCSPKGVAVDSCGNIFVADSGNHKIRKIDTCGRVSTLAGNDDAGFRDGYGADAKFHSPKGVCVNPFTGDILIADCENGAIRRVSEDGNVTTVMTGHQRGFSDEFRRPGGPIADVALTGNGDVLVAYSFGKVALRCLPKDGNADAVTYYPGSFPVVMDNNDEDFNATSVAVRPDGKIIFIGTDRGFYPGLLDLTMTVYQTDLFQVPMPPFVPVKAPMHNGQFERFYMDADFSDVCFICENDTKNPFLASKLVLAMGDGNEYWETLIRHGKKRKRNDDDADGGQIEDTRPAITIEKIPKNIFEKLLKWEYTGELFCTDKMLMAVMETARMLRMRALHSACLSRVYQTVSTENALTLLIEAHVHHLDEPKKFLMNWVKFAWNQVFKRRTIDEQLGGLPEELKVQLVMHRATY